MKDKGVIALFGGSLMDTFITFERDNEPELKDVDVACANLEACNSIVKHIRMKLEQYKNARVSVKQKHYPVRLIVNMQV